MKQTDENKLLEVKDLKVSFFTPAGELKAVGGISYSLEPGEIMGIVGESGAGKSIEAYALMGLVPTPGKIIGGEIRFEDEDVLGFNKKQMNNFRGKDVSMIFQNPETSLNPVYSIESQLTDVLRAHNRGISSSEAKKRVVEMLELTGIGNAELRMRQYPYEFSGGMLQKIMIAMALICSPKLLIADEPTTALDAAFKTQILELIYRLKKEENLSVIYITHDLGEAARICDRISVMYAGKIVEQGTVNDIFDEPLHPYTLGLLHSVPRQETEGGRLSAIDGSPANMLSLPQGCPFSTRCKSCMRICLREMPPYVMLGEKHTASCWQLVLEYLKGVANE